MRLSCKDFKIRKFKKEIVRLYVSVCVSVFFFKFYFFYGQYMKFYFY